VPGFVVTAATQLSCSHTGVVKITPHQTRVLAFGAPVVTVADVAMVGGCALSASQPPSPCLTMNLNAAGSARVLVDGQPVVCEALGPGAGFGVAASTPQQGPPLIGAVQQGVIGS